MENDNLTKNKSFADDAAVYQKKNMMIDFFINNSLYIFMIGAIIAIAIANPRFLSTASIINIISLSAANLPIALGIAGCIILTGTDLSAGRIVGLVACVAASLLQSGGYANKMFPFLDTMPISVVFGLIILIGGLLGFINGFWCGDVECENKIKEIHGIKSRCIPFDEKVGEEDVCVCCGKKAEHLVIWGIQY